MSQLDDQLHRAQESVQELRRMENQQRFINGVAWGVLISALMWGLLFLGYRALIHNDYPRQNYEAQP